VVRLRSEQLLPLAICLGQIKRALLRATGAKNQIIDAMVWGESVRGSIAVTITAAMLTTAAVAQNRPSTTAMTCQQAASLVYARGAIVLGTGGYTYDRFVRDRSFCQVTEALESAWVPTRDTPTCFVGYRCYEPSRDDLFEKW
jgi:hypothetical protein